jgi:hypothetical protein
LEVINRGGKIEPSPFSIEKTYPELVYWRLKDNRGRTVPEELKMIEKFDFLLGTWRMKYRVPESEFGVAMTGSGTGTFKRALNDKFVYFDYSASFSTGDKAEAHGIFAWDEKLKAYRYWWFENSGSFMTATCGFIEDGILYLNWHESLLSQTFRKAGPNRVVLRMEHPDVEGKPITVMEVIFTRSGKR